MNNKDTFIELVKNNITRNGIDDLLSALEKTDFYIAPASTRFHDSCKEGLVIHSIKVYNILREDCSSKYSSETLAVVSLFHDICKLGYYKTELRNNKNEQGKWEKVPYYTVDDKFAYGHGEKSVFMLMSDIELTVEEATAIRFHMGAYEGQQIWSTLATAYGQCPLALHLHFADMKATYLKE